LYQKTKKVLEKLNIKKKISIDFNFWAKKTLYQDPESGIRIRIEAYADPKHML